MLRSKLVQCFPQVQNSPRTSQDGLLLAVFVCALPPAEPGPLRVSDGFGADLPFDNDARVYSAVPPEESPKGLTGNTPKGFPLGF